MNWYNNLIVTTEERFESCMLEGFSAEHRTYRMSIMLGKYRSTVSHRFYEGLALARVFFRFSFEDNCSKLIAANFLVEYSVGNRQKTKTHM
jgi:hypothetical protein